MHIRTHACTHEHTHCLKSYIHNISRRIYHHDCTVILYQHSGILIRHRSTQQNYRSQLNKICQSGFHGDGISSKVKLHIQQHRQRHAHIGTYTHRHAHIHTCTQTDRHTNTQRERHTQRHTHTHMYNNNVTIYVEKCTDNIYMVV